MALSATESGELSQAEWIEAEARSGVGSQGCRPGWMLRRTGVRRPSERRDRYGREIERVKPCEVSQ